MSGVVVFCIGGISLFCLSVCSCCFWWWFYWWVLLLVMFLCNFGWG